MGKELNGFEQFLELAKDEHERQNKEKNNLEKRLSTIEENLGKLKDVVEKITRPSFVAQTIPIETGPKKEREFPKTFQEVLDILRTASEDRHAGLLYTLWNRISSFNINQEVFSDIKQELAVIKCMLITKAINMVDDSDYLGVYYLFFFLGHGGIRNLSIYDPDSLFVPNVLTFKSKTGADHALKYFKNEWKEMFTDSK